MTNRRQKSISTEVKVLMTTAAVAATVGGWAAMGQAQATSMQTQEVAQAPALSTTNQTIDTVNTTSTIDLTSSTTAPAPIAVTRSSR